MNQIVERMLRYTVETIVFKSVLVAGPVQNLSFRFWLSYWVSTGSPGRPGQSIFKRNSKQRHFSKKTKVNGLQQGLDRVLPGQPAGLAGSHRVMIFFIFSSTRSGSNSRLTNRARSSLKTMVEKQTLSQGVGRIRLK